MRPAQHLLVVVVYSVANLAFVLCCEICPTHFGLIQAGYNLNHRAMVQDEITCAFSFVSEKKIGKRGKYLNNCNVVKYLVTRNLWINYGYEFRVVRRACPSSSNLDLESDWDWSNRADKIDWPKI
jgi:hypothetical protein